MIAATTPTGSRTTSELPTFSSKANPAASFAYMPKVWIGEPAWMRTDSFSGMPTSCGMGRPISSARAVRPSWMRVSSATRPASGVRDQPSNAARAAATAASASATAPSGTLPSGSPVAGLVTGSLPLPAGATQAPLM